MRADELGGGVVFRRRESALSAGSSAVNDRSSYEARTVFELDVFSAIGSIVSTRENAHRFLHDQNARGVWLATLENELLRRYFERLVAFYPSVDEAAKVLTGQQHLSAGHEPTQPDWSSDPLIRLAYYTILGLLAANAGTDTVAQSGTTHNRVEELLRDSKARALPMLLAWITPQSNQSDSHPHGEFESAFFAPGVCTSVEKSVRRLRKIVRRELHFLQTFVTRYVSDIASESETAPTASIMRTHIPETYLRDSFRLPPRVKRAFLSEIEQLLEDPDSKVQGARVDVIDPSLSCHSLDSSDRRNRRFAVVSSSDQPEVFSAFGHGGQSSSARSSTSRLVSPGEEPRFQWLPTDAKVLPSDHPSVAIESEINSIHPAAFPEIYRGMEHLVAAFLPLFERVLSSIVTASSPPPRFPVANTIRDPHAQQSPKQASSSSGGESDETRDSGALDTDETLLHERCSEHYPHRPCFDETGVRNALDERPEPQDVSLRGRHIQVIPKVSTIRLTPESPSFLAHSSRKWQVDGDSAEQLVAIGFHVLERENVSTPELSFRAFAHSPPATALSRSGCTRASDEFLAFGEKIAGYHAGGYGRNFLQPWGSVALLPSRLFAVPAFLAHRLEPFELLDPTASGRLTLVTLYLVDPTHAIASTATRRSEQHDRRWVEASVNMLRDPLPVASLGLSPALLGRSLRQHAHERSATHDFPDEIAQHIAEFAASGEGEDARRRRRQARLEKERARRHGVRFLQRAHTLEQLRIALPRVVDECAHAGEQCPMDRQ